MSWRIKWPNVGRQVRELQTLLHIHIHWSNTDLLRCTNITKSVHPSIWPWKANQCLSMWIINANVCMSSIQAVKLIPLHSVFWVWIVLDKDKQMYSLLYYIHYLQTVQSNKSINVIANLSYHNPYRNWHQVHFNQQATKK